MEYIGLTLGNLEINWSTYPTLTIWATDFFFAQIFNIFELITESTYGELIEKLLCLISPSILVINTSI